MFRWLYYALFARRLKWVLTCTSEDGQVNRIRFLLYDPGREAIEHMEDAIRPLLDAGWTVLCAPRKRR